MLNQKENGECRYSSENILPNIVYEISSNLFLNSCSPWSVLTSWMDFISHESILLSEDISYAERCPEISEIYYYFDYYSSESSLNLSDFFLFCIFDNSATGK
jgi:hypothetical protein